MYKFMNNPYMHGPYMEADKGGGAGGSGADDGADDAGGDDQDDDESDEGGGEQDEKKYSQKDIDEAVKKRPCDHGDQQLQRFLSASAGVKCLSVGASRCESGDRRAEFHGIGTNDTGW